MFFMWMRVKGWFQFKTGPRERRMLFYLAVVAGVAAWKFIPRPWHPTVRLETAHHAIESTASRERTEEVGRVLDRLYVTYSNNFVSRKSYFSEREFHSAGLVYAGGNDDHCRPVKNNVQFQAHFLDYP